MTDMPELLRMGKAFFDVSGYSDITEFDIDDTEILLSDLIDSKCLLTDGESAMLGFVVFPMFMNNQTLVAQELFWWVDEEARKTGVGVDILKNAEDLAKEYGANTMMMLSIEELDGEKVNRLYEKLGYRKREQTYMRLL